MRLDELVLYGGWPDEISCIYAVSFNGVKVPSNVYSQPFLWGDSRQEASSLLALVDVAFGQPQIELDRFQRNTHAGAPILVILHLRVPALTVLPR